MVTKQSEFDGQRRARFARTRFQSFDAYDAVVRAVDEAWRGPGRPRVWIMGDDPVLYLILGQRDTYYFVTYYEMSPREWQWRLIRELETHPPDLVVFNSAFKDFDGVPNVVRVPLIFEWGIRHLSPLATTGDFSVLRHRVHREPIALDWWRNRLGAEIDLGLVPAATEITGDRGCRNRCAQYLSVTFQESASVPDEVRVRVAVRGRDFSVKFGTQPGIRSYVVRLDRLWFWAAVTNDAAPHIAVDDAVTDIADVNRERRELSGALY